MKVWLNDVVDEYFLKHRGIAYQTNAFQKGRATLVFIHGFSSSLSIWTPFIPLLSNTFNLLTYDLRGNGKSAHPISQKEFSTRTHVEDLRVLMTELHIENPIIIGYSYGSIIAMEYIRHFPHTVRKAIFIAPVYGLHWRFVVFATWKLLLFMAKHGPNLSHNDERVDYSQYQESTDDRHTGLTWRQLRATGSRSYFWQLQDMYTSKSDAHWRELSLPCHIVHGSEDTIIPVRYARLLTYQLKDAKLSIIPGGNHMLPIRHAKEITHIIQDEANKE